MRLLLISAAFGSDSGGWKRGRKPFVVCGAHAAAVRKKASRVVRGIRAGKPFAHLCSVKKYRGKEVTFHKPFFPGYVFLRATSRGGRTVRQNRYVANLLEPPNQAEFEAQLSDIREALETLEESRNPPGESSLHWLKCCCPLSTFAGGGAATSSLSGACSVAAPS